MWQSPSRNLFIGDVVIPCEDNTVPSQWPLVRIVKTHRGKDSINRVAVQTSSGNISTPPIVHLYSIIKDRLYLAGSISNFSCCRIVRST